MGSQRPRCWRRAYALLSTSELVDTSATDNCHVRQTQADQSSRQLQQTREIMSCHKDPVYCCFSLKFDVNCGRLRTWDNAAVGHPQLNFCTTAYIRNSQRSCLLKAWKRFFHSEEITNLLTTHDASVIKVWWNIADLAAANLLVNFENLSA